MARLAAGQSAPEFTLPDATGVPVSLRDVLEASTAGVVVYFYPKAGTPGCTVEACDFRDNLASFAGLGYRVIGVSADPPEDLRAFVAAEGLTFPLLSDGDHAVSEAYGTWGPKTINGNTFDGVHRSTFVVGLDGALKAVEYDVDATGHVARLRARLAG